MFSTHDVYIHFVPSTIPNNYAQDTWGWLLQLKKLHVVQKWSVCVKNAVPFFLHLNCALFFAQECRKQVL